MAVLTITAMVNVPFLAAAELRQRGTATPERLIELSVVVNAVVLLLICRGVDREGVDNRVRRGQRVANGVSDAGPGS